MKLTRSDILRLFDLLEAELAEEEAEAELFLVGGAVMCLALRARDATYDVDGYFEPTAMVRDAARRVAIKEGISESWLNDAVKGFLGTRRRFEPFLELEHLRVFVAHPEYLLAMKCAAMRLGAEFRDLDDVRYLLRYLDVSSVDEALTIVNRYFDDSQLLPKTRLALEELLG